MKSKTWKAILAILAGIFYSQASMASGYISYLYTTHGYVLVGLTSGPFAYYSGPDVVTPTMLGSAVAGCYAVDISISAGQLNRVQYDPDAPRNCQP